jgi:hypothetical protein
MEFFIFTLKSTKQWQLKGFQQRNDKIISTFLFFFLCILCHQSRHVRVREIPGRLPGCSPYPRGLKQSVPFRHNWHSKQGEKWVTG